MTACWMNLSRPGVVMDEGRKYPFVCDACHLPGEAGSPLKEGQKHYHQAKACQDVRRDRARKKSIAKHS